MLAIFSIVAVTAVLFALIHAVDGHSAETRERLRREQASAEPARLSPPRSYEVVTYVPQKCEPPASDEHELHLRRLHALKREQDWQEANHRVAVREIERSIEIAATKRRLGEAEQPRLPEPPAPKHEQLLNDGLALLRREYRAAGHTDTREIDQLIASRKASHGPT